MPLNYGELHDFDKLFDIVPQAAWSIVAGGSGDATEKVGYVVDRLKATRDKHVSGALVIVWEATLAQDATLSLAANFEDDTAVGMATAVADFGTALANAVVGTGPSGGGVVKGATWLRINLEAARQYVRAMITPNLSAANTDTARLAAFFVFGPGEVIPVTRLGL